MSPAISDACEAVVTATEDIVKLCETPALVGERLGALWRLELLFGKLVEMVCANPTTRSSLDPTLISTIVNRVKASLQTGPVTLGMRQACDAIDELLIRLIGVLCTTAEQPSYAPDQIFQNAGQLRDLSDRSVR